jgi:lipopolysaccharide heptosyltransferase II
MRILIVRLREIGDVVFTTPAVRAIRRRFPNAHITYIVEPAASAIVEHNPHIDELIVAPRPSGISRLRSELALIRRLRAAAYDIAIDFHSGPRASILTWLSGAPVRVGYAVVGRSWMYTRLIARPRELRPRHSVENQWDLLAALDIGPPDRTEYPVEMALDDRTAGALAERLARAGVRGDHRLIVMHVSAGNPFRRWPVGSFAAVAAGLAGRDPARRVVITSGPSDRQAAERVMVEAQTLLGDDRGRVLECGEFSLSELRALVDRAAVYIGGDSGPMHVAATSHVPIVSLYGPTLPARSAPWRATLWPAESVEVTGLECRPCDQRSCLPGDFRCLTWIQPQQVIEAAERALTG